MSPRTTTEKLFDWIYDHDMLLLIGFLVCGGTLFALLFGRSAPRWLFGFVFGLLLVVVGTAVYLHHRRIRSRDPARLAKALIAARLRTRGPIEREVVLEAGELAESVRKAVARARTARERGDLPEASGVIDALRTEHDLDRLLTVLYADRTLRRDEPTGRDNEIAAVELLHGDAAAAEAALDETLARSPDETRALGWKGYVQMLRADHHEAEGTFRRVLDMTSTGTHLDARMLALGGLALVHDGRGEVDRAQEYLEQSRAVRAQVFECRREARSRDVLADMAVFDGDVASAEKCFEAALGAHAQLGRPEDVAVEYEKLAGVYAKAGSLGKAEALYAKALEAYRELDRTEAVVTQHAGLGDICLRRGELDRSEELHAKALDMAKGTGWPSGVARQHGKLGTVRLTRGELDQAEALFTEALSIYERIGELEGVSAQQCNLGLVAEARGDLDRAEEWFRRADKTRDDAMDKRLDAGERLRVPGALDGWGEFGASAGLARIYLARGKRRRAAGLLRRTLKAEWQSYRLDGMAVAYRDLGNVALTRGRLRRAEELHRKSLELAEQCNWLEAIAEAHGNLGAVAKARGGLNSAREFWTKALELYDRIGMPHMVQKTRGQLDALRG